MSEPTKSSRSKRKDVQLVVSCQTPHGGVTEYHSTSVYEIDIQSGFDYHKGGAKDWYVEKVPEGVDIKIGSKDSSVPNQEHSKDDAEHLCPEAYYPNVTETLSSDQRSTRMQNESFATHRDSLAYPNTEKDRKSFSGKANKKRQLSSADDQKKFRKELKNYIIDNFMEHKSTEMRTMVQNYQGVLDSNEVHFHHHEHHHHHHHHYYPNANALEVKGNAPQLMKENCSPSQEVFFATVMTNSNGASGEKKLLDLGKPVSKASAMTEKTYETVKSIPGAGRPPPGEVSKGRRDLLPSEVLPENRDRLLSEVILENRSKRLTEMLSENQDRRLPEYDDSATFVNKSISKNVQESAISLGSRTTDVSGLYFLKNSEVSTTLENFEVQGVERKKSGKSYTSLMDNFKNFGHFMSPIVITDQKSVPKILYIRCDCSPWNGMDDVETCSQNDSSEETDDLDRMIDEGTLWKQAGRCSGPNTNYTSDQVQKEGSADELEFEVWTSKLRTELQEIKRELKRIEEKQPPERMASQPLRRGESRRPGRPGRPGRLGRPGHPITVYTSKTYIVRSSEDSGTDA